MAKAAPARDDNAPPEPVAPSPAQISDWLAYAYEPLPLRRDEVMQALARQMAAHPEIRDDEVAGAFAENLRMAGEVVSTARTAHRTVKAPFLAANRTIDGWLARMTDPMDAVCDRARALLTQYANRKADAERTRRLAEASAARARAEALAVQAANAMDNGSGAPLQVLDDAANAAQEADRLASEADDAPAALGRTRGIYGAIASLRTNWTYRTTNKAAVPDPFKMIDDASVRAAMKVRDPKSGRPLAVIPGIEWVAVRKVAVR